MSGYIRYTNFLTLKRGTLKADASGQLVPSYDAGTEYPCIYVSLGTANRVEPIQFDEDVVQVIIDGEVNAGYNDQVINIRDRNGTVILRGPLQVFSITESLGYSGVVRNLRLKLKRVKNC